MVAIMEFIRLDAHIPVPVRGRYTYYPSAAETRRDGGGASEGGRFFQLLAEIEITGDAQGVICSQQSRCGGYSLFLRDGKLVFVHDVPDAAPVRAPRLRHARRSASTSWAWSTPEAAGATTRSAP